uniref:interferon-induced, double-stranded RNA-activated protein kinase-like n=1 Tax=Semicossyphus pulcher TaxID=241346 RepID=UPI0037E8143E
MMDAGNYVARLNEYAQRRRFALHFEFLGSDGPDHNKTFTQRAVLNGKVYLDGVGKTKKEAKHNAAKNALRCLLEDEQVDSVDSTDSAAESPAAAAALQTSSSNINYICWLNEYGQKNRLTVRAVESNRPGPNGATPCCSFVVGGKEYPAAIGETKREAKEEAAKLVHHEIFGRNTSQTPVRSSVYQGGASPVLSARSATLESSESSSSTSDSVVFADSSNSSGAQLNQRVRNCALETPQKQNGKVADNHLNMGKSRNESKFTTDFDSIKKLSSGAYGKVYKARSKLLKDKSYAVKIVRHDDKCLREVRTLSDLHHRNIVRYYTFWMEETGYQCDHSGCRSSYSSNSFSSSSPKPMSTENSSAKFLYIQMELCDTKTLRSWIDEKNAQSLQDFKRREEALNVARQIFSGVKYIHSKNHIHRDLKPDNILFGLNGEVKIGDFGLVTRDDSLMDRTVDQGTPTYMAPEQRTKTYDKKVDIFAMGLIYLELLWTCSTGHERVKVLIDAKLKRFPTSFSERFFAEREIIKSMLCERPEDRPEASTLKAELEILNKTIKALLAQRTV